MRLCTFTLGLRAASALLLAATAVPAFGQTADLEVVSVNVPGNASEGQQLTYDVQVRNNGPGAPTDVFVDFVPPATVSFVSASGCPNDATFGDDAGCDIGPLASGATLSFSAVYQVKSFPNDIIRASIPVTVAISATGTDPNPDNNEAAVETRVDLSDNDGCSTGGAGTLFGLLSLVALRLGRRRSR